MIQVSPALSESIVRAKDEMMGTLRKCGREALEPVIGCLGRQNGISIPYPENPKSIFVLRNNDFGDLLVVTPLFQALRRRFPETYLAAGIGDWNRDILKGNPYLSEVVPVNAPWFNKFTRNRNAFGALDYIFSSGESRNLAKRKFDIGIDLLGSSWGSLLLLHLQVGFRMGVKGYAGGHSAMHRTTPYHPREHVGRQALRFAELLGASEIPECRPQLFLESEEIKEGEKIWAAAFPEGRGKRMVLAPGAGFRIKGWPEESYIRLVKKLPELANVQILVLGGAEDKAEGAALEAASPQVKCLAGRLNLRETFALTRAADLVICNSSLLFHVSAAFSKPVVVLLGPFYDSAKEHFAQWGYAGLSHVLGKEKGERDTIFSPEEVACYLQSNGLLG